MSFSEKKSRNLNKDFIHSRNSTLYTSHHADTQRIESFKINKESSSQFKNMKKYFCIFSKPIKIDKFPLLTEGNSSDKKNNSFKPSKNIRKFIEDNEHSFLTKLKKIDFNYKFKKKKEKKKNEPYDRIFNKIKLFKTKTHLMDNRLNILYAENIDQFHKEVWNRKYVKLNEDTINRDNKEIDEAHFKVKYLKNTMDYVYPKYVSTISYYNNMETSSFRNRKFLSPSQQNLRQIIKEKIKFHSYLKKPIKVKKFIINKIIE